ncbi:BBSome-interacting protein 1 [Acipenser ruthenus]|uniref:BBSome-interacting protein 1 n=1 Tax=Acipenser ruthenus TaxID=7906 RepID=A0A444U2D6_ACIRT|nr:BBSome-interacting protein 1 [Acipenser ruthenus]
MPNSSRTGLPHPKKLCLVTALLISLGQLSMEDVPTMVLCKPKLLPLKSVTLEKLEKMQRDAQETIRQQEIAVKE